MKNSILIVETEDDIRSRLNDILIPKGFNVTQAICAEQSVDHLKYHIPDIIISETSLPGLDGYSLLDYVQNEPELPYIPFIFLTDQNALCEIRRGMSSGADDYLTKPIDEQELMGAVNAGLKKRDRIKKYLDDIRESFALAVPHELRTPIMPIIGTIDLLIEEFENLEKRHFLEYLQTIKENALRLSKRIEKFILLSSILGELHDRLSLEKIKSEKSEISESYVKNIFDEFAFANPGVKYKIRIERSSLAIHNFCLDGMIRELIENSFKYSLPGTSIVVTGKVTGELFNLTIRNHGVLTDAQLKKVNLFEQFRTIEAPKNGSGIGLFIVRKIIEMFNGKFEIESNQAKGIEVTVVLKT